MTTVAHILSGSYIGLKVAGVSVEETGYVVMSLISGGILDLDHLFYLIRDRKYYKKMGYGGHLHKARSPLHELMGFLVIGVLMLGMSFFDLKLALVIGIPFMIHLIEDMVVGISMPFNGFDKTEIHMLPQRRPLKILLDILVLAVFGFLWIKYLNGAV